MAGIRKKYFFCVFVFNLFWKFKLVQEFKRFLKLLLPYITIPLWKRRGKQNNVCVNRYIYLLVSKDLQFFPSKTFLLFTHLWTLPLNLYLSLIHQISLTSNNWFVNFNETLSSVKDMKYSKCSIKIINTYEYFMKSEK